MELTGIDGRIAGTEAAEPGGNTARFPERAIINFADDVELFSVRDEKFAGKAGDFDEREPRDVRPWSGGARRGIQACLRKRHESQNGRAGADQGDAAGAIESGVRDGFGEIVLRGFGGDLADGGAIEFRRETVQMFFFGGKFDDAEQTIPEALETALDNRRQIFLRATF